MKKILIICMLTLIALSGCEQKEEVVENNEPTIIETQNPTLFTYKENITIDMTKDYDINEVVTPNEGVVIIDELDAENKILKVSAVKGDVMENVNISVELYNPYPIVCKFDPDKTPNYSNKPGLLDTYFSFLNKETIEISYWNGDVLTIPFNSKEMKFYMSPTMPEPEEIYKTGNASFDVLTTSYSNVDGSRVVDHYICDKSLPF